jgi:hypothetical protein
MLYATWEGTHHTYKMSSVLLTLRDSLINSYQVLCADLNV